MKSQPLWKGPEVDGVTYSMLCQFLVCRERFRICVIEGLATPHEFNQEIEYGHMWHTCEEALGKRLDWSKALATYCRNLCNEHRTQQSIIDKWYRICKIQFPIYLKYWSKNKDEKQGKPLFREWVFNHTYYLPSGRKVKLRGKMDGSDILPEEPPGIYLYEHKTKANVDEEATREILSYDLQTNFYLTVLDEVIQFKDDPQSLLYKAPDLPLRGVRYNVIRRPLSGGKGTIKQKESETLDDYYKRLANYIQEEPETYFFRWKSLVTPTELARFQANCLNPILENLCWWYDEVAHIESDYPPPPANWRHPYNVYNYLNEGYTSDLDHYMNTGSKTGLVPNTLFRELV